ncbi:11821_t:CDS:2, partial [Ambispora gerdemannii]
KETPNHRATLPIEGNTQLPRNSFKRNAQLTSSTYKSQYTTPSTTKAKTIFSALLINH